MQRWPHRYRLEILLWPSVMLVMLYSPGILCGQGNQPEAGGELTVIVGKSISIDSVRPIKRVAAANENVVECVAIGQHELLINGKGPGETSIVFWQDDDQRVRYDVTVLPNSSKLSAVRGQLAREFSDCSIDVTLENDTVFVRGTLKDLASADRVIAIASTLGKVVNLLRVMIPPVEPQILLNIRFANVERSVSSDLGLALANGAFNQTTALGPGQPVSLDGGKTFTLSQAVNLLLFRKDINLLAAIQALENKRLLDILAEPNLLVINGTQANFVAGGEFPYPVVQSGANGNAVTIAFKEYGIRVSFLPQITPRGTIRLQVAPEVSSLDYNNSVTVAGTVVPATSTRRVQTEVELESGQSFVIAGLLDRQATESLSQVPGLSHIPLLGKLFESRSINHNESELLILVTPEIVQPIGAGQPLPEIEDSTLGQPRQGESSLRQPGLGKAKLTPAHPPSDSIPIEVLATPLKKIQPPSLPQK